MYDQVVSIIEWYRALTWLAITADPQIIRWMDAIRTKPGTNRIASPVKLIYHLRG
jgi:hypothetical protein